LICFTPDMWHSSRKLQDLAICISVWDQIKPYKDLKGRRQFIPKYERAYMLSALSCVHKVFITTKGSGLLDFLEDMTE